MKQAVTTALISAIVALGLYLGSARAADDLPGVTSHRVAILYCYEHFNLDDLMALGTMLAVEADTPLASANLEGMVFAKRVADVCKIDPLSENCETPAGKMQACISAIILG